MYVENYIISYVCMCYNNSTVELMVGESYQYSCHIAHTLSIIILHKLNVQKVLEIRRR